MVCVCSGFYEKLSFWAKAVLTGVLFSALVSCGGGGGSGDNDSATLPTPNSYFPNNAGLQWKYSNSDSSVTLGSKITLNNTALLPLQYPTGGKEYFSSNTNSISLHGFYSPYVYVSGAGAFKADVRLSQPLTIYQTGMAAGTTSPISGGGTVDISPTYGRRSISFTGNTQYIGEETISVPYGTYTAKHISISITSSVTIQGQTLSIPSSYELWLAEGVGIIRRYEGGQTLSLTDFIGGDRDSDGIVDNDDNCPAKANPDQNDLDNDLIGDVCDDDANGDGVTDAAIATPSTNLDFSSFDIAKGNIDLSFTQQDSSNLPWTISLEDNTLGNNLVVSQTSGDQWPINVTLNVNSGLSPGNYSAILVVSSGSQTTHVSINYTESDIVLADAGNDITIDERQAAPLTGTYDLLDGELLSVAWSQVSGPDIVLTSSSTLSTGFTAPEVLTTQVVRLGLTIENTLGDSHTDYIDVTINPVVDPGVVNLSVLSSGTVTTSSASLNNCNSECSDSFTNATPSTIDLTATPAQNYEFVGWQGACTGTGVCSLSVGAELDIQNVTAEFRELPFATLNISINGGGSVIESKGYAQCGDPDCTNKQYDSVSYELLAASRSGYIFTGWSGDCTGTGNCQLPMTLNQTYSVTATFATDAAVFSVCPGNPSDAFSATGTDAYSNGVSSYIPLCNGWVLIGDYNNNQIILRDVINGITDQTYQLTTAPVHMALDKVNAMLYVTHGITSFITRINLATGEMLPLPATGAESVAVSQFGELFVQSSVGVLIYDSNSSLLQTTLTGIIGSQIQYNDATDRLITSFNNYFYDRTNLSLTLEGRSSGSGSGAGCDYVRVSPDGIHAVKPCGGGNGVGYTVYDFDSHDPTNVLGEWNTGAYPSGVAFAPSNLYVLLTDNSNLQLFNVTTHALVDSVAGAGCTYGDLKKLGVSSDGKLLYGITICGFDNDSAILKWWAYDTNQ